MSSVADFEKAADEVRPPPYNRRDSRTDRCHTPVCAVGRRSDTLAARATTDTRAQVKNLKSKPSDDELLQVSLTRGV